MLYAFNGFSQGARQAVLFSGFVVDAKNSDPVPGVHLYIPKAGRGVATNPEGYFMLPTLPGDSIVVSSIGYKNHYYIIPQDKLSSYSVVIELIEDTTSLPVIEVFPYPTEELFKEAFLALELPDEELRKNLEENLNQRIMARMAMDIPMDARMNYRHQMYQDIQFRENRNFRPTIQLLNPFAWANFVKSIKRGDFKKEKWKGN